MKRDAIMDRALESVWLDVALQVALEARSDTARAILASRLRDRLDLSVRWDKRLTVLAHVWLDPPKEAKPIVNWALQRASRFGDPRLLHVGAMLATYSFFGDVCAAIGWELSLHAEARLTSIRRRLRAGWGDRPEVDVAARAVTRTLRNLGVVAGRKGALAVVPGEQLPLPPGLALWFVHALLLTRGTDEIDAREVRSCPELFMVGLPRTWDMRYPYLERFNEGGNRVVYRLRRQPGPSRPGRRPFPQRAAWGEEMEFGDALPEGGCGDGRGRATARGPAGVKTLSF